MQVFSLTTYCLLGKMRKILNEKKKSIYYLHIIQYIQDSADLITYSNTF